MNKDSKYFYITDVSKGNSPTNSQLVKWDKLYSVDVNENVDFEQCITVLIIKAPRKDINKPISTNQIKGRTRWN